MKNDSLPDSALPKADVEAAEYDAPAAYFNAGQQDATVHPDEISELRSELASSCYILVMLAIGLSAGAAERFLGVNGYRVAALGLGTLFLWAAIGRPRFVYLMVRRAGWFASVRNPTWMRAVFWLFAAVLLGLGLLLPGED